MNCLAMTQTLLLLEEELLWRHADAGTLLPFRKEDRTRLTWWTNWFNFWGGILFCVG